MYNGLSLLFSNTLRGGAQLPSVQDSVSASTEAGAHIVFPVSSNCSDSAEYLTVKCWPHYLLQELTVVFTVAVYVTDVKKKKKTLTAGSWDLCSLILFLPLTTLRGTFWPYFTSTSPQQSGEATCATVCTLSDDGRTQRPEALQQHAWMKHFWRAGTQAVRLLFLDFSYCCFDWHHPSAARCWTSTDCQNPWSTIFFPITLKSGFPQGCVLSPLILPPGDVCPQVSEGHTSPVT